MNQTEPNPEKFLSGVQMLDRVVLIIDSVASRFLHGAKLVEVAADCDLNRATTHRLLQALVATHLLEQDEGDLRYYVGSKLAHFAEAAGQRFGLERITLPARQRIAQVTGDTVFLTVRTGMRMICTARTEGEYPVKVLTLNVGSSRPLGVGSGGLAILSALSEKQCQKILNALSGQFEQFNLSNEEVSRLVAAGRKTGYCVDRDTVIQGVTGLSVPLIGTNGQVFGSIGIAAISTRMTQERTQEIALLLLEEAKLIGAEKQMYDETNGYLEEDNETNKSFNQEGKV